MIELSEIERYLNGLYEMYDSLETEYKNLHKRSRKHNCESAEKYYLRWKNRMIEEIRKVEKEVFESAQLIIKNVTY